jgi:hypothetical protein
MYAAAVWAFGLRSGVSPSRQRENLVRVSEIAYGSVEPDIRLFVHDGAFPCTFCVVDGTPVTTTRSGGYLRKGCRDGRERDIPRKEVISTQRRRKYCSCFTKKKKKKAQNTKNKDFPKCAICGTLPLDHHRP